LRRPCFIAVVLRVQIERRLNLRVTQDALHGFRFDFRLVHRPIWLAVTEVVKSEFALGGFSRRSPTWQPRPDNVVPITTLWSGRVRKTRKKTATRPHLNDERISFHMGCLFDFHGRTVSGVPGECRFVRTLGSFSELAGTATIAGHDVLRMIGKMAKIELDRGDKIWAQLYAAMAPQRFGRDLNHNAL